MFVELFVCFILFLFWFSGVNKFIVILYIYWSRVVWFYWEKDKKKKNDLPNGSWIWWRESVNKREDSGPGKFWRKGLGFRFIEGGRLREKGSRQFSGAEAVVVERE